jgi:outer membrane protein
MLLLHVALLGNVEVFEMRNIIKWAVATFIFVPVLGSYADNLSQVYQQALASDPVFKKAQADWMSAKENLPLAMTGNGSAGSGLFPNIDFTGSIGKTYSHNMQQKNKSYSVTLTQPIFNLSTWESIGSANYGVKAATATYLAAEQDLIDRVSTAYLEVLRANEKLHLTLVQQKQFEHEYKTQQEKFRVGIIAITGVYDAKAKYDQSVAQTLKDRNSVQDALENLSAITGKNYKSIKGLNKIIPLVMPKPKSMDSWVNIAERQNYGLQADLNTMYMNQQNSKVAETAKVPTLNLVGSYGNNINNGSLDPTGQSPINTSQEQTQVGLNLNFPILRGGYDIVNTKQARYNYLSASDQVSITQRQVVNKTRQAYLGIQYGISQIKADKQAIISAKNQLQSTKEGYIVGTRTMVNVLDSMTNLTSAQLQHANDRYDYIESIFNLKEEAGTLSPSDIGMINHWLGKPIKLS